MNQIAFISEAFFLVPQSNSPEFVHLRPTSHSSTPRSTLHSSPRRKDSLPERRGRTGKQLCKTKSFIETDRLLRVFDLI